MIKPHPIECETVTVEQMAVCLANGPEDTAARTVARAYLESITLTTKDVFTKQQAEDYATGFRNGKRSAFSINDGVGRVYQVDDSLIKVNVRLSENILDIETLRKRFGHWEVLQGIPESELARMERDSIRTEFEVRMRLKAAGVDMHSSHYDGDGDVSKSPLIKPATNV